VRRLESALAGVALAVFSAGAVLFVLELPWFTSLLAARYSLLPDATALEYAQIARGFVATGSRSARTALEGLMAADAVSHLDDVRRVMAAANVLTLVLGLALALWVGTSARRRPRELATALFAAAGLLIALVVIAGAIALSDFDAFFSAFHGLFFAPGTWTFPSDSLLIRLFPEPFWANAGVAWGLGLLGLAALYALGGWVLRRRSTAPDH
jgi:uncharacterized membrane protein